MFLTAAQCEALRDGAEPDEGYGDADDGGARLIYRLTSPITEVWPNGETVTVPAGTWIREVFGKTVIGYSADV